MDIRKKPVAQCDRRVGAMRGMLDVRAEVRSSPIRLPGAEAGNAFPRADLTTGTAAESAALGLAQHTPDYADLFERAPVGYMLLDAAGCIHTINQTGAAMLGWDASWLAGKPFSRWVVNNDKQLFVTHQRRLRHCARCASQELRIKNRQGRSVTLRLESMRGASSGQDITASRSVMLDVSCDERSARKLRRLQSQLTHLTRRHTAGELASSLAHELNQPLGTIVLYCDAAIRLLDAGESQSGELAETLLQAREAASFASDVVRHLRCFLRDDKELHRVCEPDTLVHDVATLIEAEARDNDIRLCLDLEPGLPRVRVDSVQIEQVLLNLAHNSIEAMNECRRGADQVTIGVVRHKTRQVRFSVTDTGPGFAAANTGRLFDAFYTTKTEGMGMGLCISRTIVEAHGGEMWAAAAPDGGAGVYFVLPTIDDSYDGS